MLRACLRVIALAVGSLIAAPVPGAVAQMITIPNHEGYQPPERTLQGDRWYEEGKRLMQEERWEEAVVLLDKALGDAFTQDAHVLNDLGIAYWQFARETGNKTHLKWAADYFRQSIRTMPRENESYGNAIRLYLEEGKLDEARDVLDDFVRLTKCGDDCPTYDELKSLIDGATKTATK